MNVLLIGATSTVATHVATELAHQGARIFAVARNEAKLEKLKLQLGNQMVGHYCFDFTDCERCPDAVEAAQATLQHIDLVLLAHGDLTDQLASEEDLKVALHTYQANLLSVIAFLIPAIKILRAQGVGKLGVITSVAGDRGRPRNFTYGSAKGAVSLYLQGWRSVLWDSGIDIYDFRMGPVDSPMTVSHEKNFSFSSPEKVAKLIVLALKNKGDTVYVPGYWRWVMWVVKWMPEPLFQRLGFLSAR